MSDGNFYIVLKLTSGEQVMGVLRQEDETAILVENPMVMRTAVDFEAGKERITAAPLCPFSDDNEFVLDKKNVLYIKKLHFSFISHYKNIVKDYAESTNFVPEGQDDPLSWESDTPSIKKEEEINWDEKLKMFVNGNDTIN